MKRSVYGVLAALALVIATGGRLAAQETGTPVFKAPYRAFTAHEFGGNLSFPSGSVNFGLEGFYSYGHGPFDLGFRGGFEDLEGSGDTRILLGADFRTRVIHATEKIPVDGAFTLGLGLNAGDGPDVVFIPFGLSLGRRFLLEGSKISFVPYVHPVLGPAFSNDDTDFNAALGLGVDVRFSSTVDFRLSGGVGDVEGISLGLAIVR